MYMYNNASAAHCSIVQITETQVAGTANPMCASNIGKEIDTVEVAGTTTPVETGNIKKRTVADETATSVETGKHQQED